MMNTAKLSLLALSLLAATASATDTLTIGTSDAPSCSSNSNVALLDDGVTRVGAELHFDWDGVNNELLVTVDNTSYVSAGKKNPLITSVWFNLPANAIDSITLLSQTGSAGPAPAFAFLADTDFTDGKNKLKAGCLGAFGAELDINGIPGGIANPNANAVAGPKGAAVIGPVVFRFAVTGPDLGSLTDASFSGAQSVNPPGTYQVNGAMHFQGSDGSGKIGNGFLPSPLGWVSGNPALGQTIALNMSAAAGSHTVLAVSLSNNPTMFGAVGVPLTFPWLQLVNNTMPPLGTQSLSVAIPFDPALVDMTFYFGVVTLAWGGGVLDASESFNITIAP